MSRFSRRESTVNSNAENTRSQGASDAGTARTRRARTAIVGTQAREDATMEGDYALSTEAAEEAAETTNLSAIVFFC